MENQLKILSNIAETQPQAAYSAHTFGFKRKFRFFLRIVHDIANYLLPTDETLRSRFMPAIKEDDICSDAERALLGLPDDICSDAERALLGLRMKFGDSGLQNVCELANIKLLNFKEITRELYDNAITQNKDFQSDSEKTKTIKNQVKTRKVSNYKIILEELRISINKKMKRFYAISNEAGSSSWLSVISMREFNYVLNKSQF